MGYEILKEVEDNMYERAKLLKNCKDNEKLRSAVYLMCKKDPIYFFKYFVWTDRNPTLFPEKFGNAVPFILFEYQEEYVQDMWDAIQMGRKPVEERTKPTSIFSEKSRQMGFSWTYAGMQTYGYIFHNMKSLYISMRADEVDLKGDIKSQFEKIRFILNNLPSWMLPEGYSKKSGSEHNKYMVISRADSTGNIKGESASPLAGRGGTTDFTIFDEMSFMAYAQAINASVSASTPSKFYNSTPNGEGNEYYRMRLKALPIGHPDKPKKETEQTLRYHRCHRSENPLYTKEWYKWKTQDLLPEVIAAEYEIDYNVAVQGRVYPAFRGHTHDIDYDPTKPLYVIIDNSHGGTDPNAVIILQPEYKTHFWNIIDCISISCDVPDMASILAGAPKIALTDIELEFLNRYQNYNWRKAIFVSDPYDTHSRVVNNHHPDGMVIFEEYRKVGIFLNVPNTKNNPKTTQIIKTRNNLNRIKINERCADFISAIQNCKYPDVKEGHNRTQPVDLPVHDWTSHYRTCLEYATIYLLDNFVEVQKQGEPEKTLQEIKDPITGEIKYIYN